MTLQVPGEELRAGRWVTPDLSPNCELTPIAAGRSQFAGDNDNFGTIERPRS
jgi:hypothetical protein